LTGTFAFCFPLSFVPVSLPQLKHQGGIESHFGSGWGLNEQDSRLTFQVATAMLMPGRVAMPSTSSKERCGALLFPSTMRPSGVCVCGGFCTPGHRMCCTSTQYIQMITSVTLQALWWMGGLWGAVSVIYRWRIRLHGPLTLVHAFKSPLRKQHNT
jgi:hypothetical protein